MNPEFIKLFAPALIVIAWISFALRVKNPLVIGAGLFFASYAAFSSNFIFVYRELHQIIQILLITTFVIPAIRTGRFFRVNFIFVVLLTFIGISLIYAPFDEDAKSQLLNLLVAAGVVNFLFSALRSAEDLDKVLRFLATLAVLLACIGFAEFAFTGQTRIEATFANCNYFGLFLGVGSCIVLVIWRGWQKYIASVFIISAIILSGSRSAIVFPVLQFLWIVYQRGSLRKSIPLVIVFILIAVFVFNSGVTRYTNISDTEGSDAERIIISQIALRMANDHPLTGVGWGRFISEFDHYSSQAERVFTSSGVIDVSDQERRVTHNDYLRILAEIGGIAFMLAISLSIYGVKILITKSGFGRDYILPIYFGLLLFSMGHNNMNSAFFWFFFMLPFFLNRKQPDSRKRMMINA